MVHKMALVVGAIASAGILAVALAAAGFAPVAPVATAMDNTVAQTPIAQTPQISTVTDNVYVKPTPKQRVIRITKPAVVRAPQQPNRRATQGNDDAAEHENEGSGD